ncbi:hypothetical protein P12x_000404 [Tundrisphaera lichenicola]|uniref:hypothetical protein n=1 Tax=Tundrisphaera lichenicola TaxID=2029860 RepID=UPI003EBD0D42
MRIRILIPLMLLIAPSLTFGQDDPRAMAVAKETLDRGSALFDRRDAKAMTATFVEDAEIILIKRASDSDKVELENRRGKAAIEKTYSDIFKDREPEHRCRNTVESARFVGEDLLLIRGRFAFNVDQGDLAEFVQVRAREDNQWKIVTLQLMPIPKE